MAKRTWALLCATPLLLPSCWKSFTVSEDDGGSGGGTSTGGTVGSGGSSSGGTAGAAGAAGSSTGGTIAGTEIALSPDSYQLVQGDNLDIAAPGVLDNDEGDGLSVVSFEVLTTGLPSELEPVSLNVAADGTLTFEPAPDFWGTFELSYTATDDAGEQATAQVSVRIAPRLISLAAISAGYGGFAVDGGPGEGLGRDLAAAGDANDDGIDDFVVGAPDAAAGDGTAYLVLGRTNPSTFQVDVATSRVVSMTVDADGAVSECLGVSVDGLGDVNGDDVPDLVLGAPGCTPHAGAVYVVHGGNTLSGTRDLALLTDDPSSAAGYRLIGQGQERVGEVVLGRTDVEGDGIPDVVLSIQVPNPPYIPIATMVAVLSSAAGLGGDVSAARDLFIAVGGQDGTFPVDASRLGDLDGDFLEEVLVGHRQNFASVEASIVVLTPEWPASMDDVPSGYSFGTSSLTGRISGVGDFDGDGMPDLVACRGALAGGETTQACDLFLGSALGDPPVAGEWTVGNLTDATPPDPTGGVDFGGTAEDDFVIAHADGACLVWGRTAIPSADLDCTDLPDGDGVGFSTEPGYELTRAAVVGDVNGDGFDDLALSAGQGGGGAGRVYVVFGGSLD